MTIAQYNKVVTQENKESLAAELCDKYVRHSIISIDPKDFLSIMEGVDALSITEVDGDNMAEMTHELAKHSYGSKLLVLLNSSPNDDMTMKDMACVNRRLSTLEKSIDVTWGVGRTAENFPHFQIIVITTSAPYKRKTARTSQPGQSCVLRELSNKTYGKKNRMITFLFALVGV